MAKARLGVLISGGGSNLQAIIDRVGEGKLDAEIAVVISNKKDAFGLKRAQKYGIVNRFIDRSDYQDDSQFNRAIMDELRKNRVDLVVLAGYMRLVGKEILDAYPFKVINLHPALLPAFPGADGIRDALEYGVRVTGVTVHFADSSFDTGPIILQDFVPVHQEDTYETLAERIHKTEHRLLPWAIHLLIEGRVKVDGRKVRILGKQ